MRQGSEVQCVLCGALYSVRRKNEAVHLCPVCWSPERAKEYKVLANNLYRAQRLSLPATLTLEQWLATLDHFGWKCAYCDGPYQALDHFMPVSEGGGTTVDNCVPICIDCNYTKAGTPPHLILKASPRFYIYQQPLKKGVRRIRKYFKSLNLPN